MWMILIIPFPIPGYETDVMIQTTDSDGHEYARSAQAINFSVDICRLFMLDQFIRESDEKERTFIFINFLYFKETTH